MKVEELKKKLEEIGIRSTKIRGQNFLISNTVLEDILKAGELTKKDSVLEIGPGFGVLTRELLKVVGCVSAVEVDTIIGKILEPLTKQGLKLTFGDVRQIPNDALIGPCVTKNYKLIANIPYNITSEILEKFLIEETSPNLIVIMIQYDVAKKIVGEPPNSSRLGIFVRYFGHPEIIRTVSNECFWPKPKVDSAVLKIRRYPKEIFEKREIGFSREEFFRMIKIGFSSPRKKLSSNLTGLGLIKSQLKDLEKKIGLSGDSRPENLNIEHWIALAKLIFSKD